MKKKNVIVLIVAICAIIALSIIQIKTSEAPDGRFYNTRIYCNELNYNGTDWVLEPSWTLLNMQVLSFDNGTAKQETIDHIYGRVHGQILNFTLGSYYWHSYSVSPLIVAWCPLLWQSQYETITYEETATWVMQDDPSGIGCYFQLLSGKPIEAKQ